MTAVILVFAIFLPASHSSAAGTDRRGIQTKITNDHVPVPGTRLSLIPPDEFRISKYPPGFVQESTGASITVTEMRSSFEKATAGLTERGLSGRREELLEKEQFEINGFDAILLRTREPGNATGLFMKWTLVLGNSNETVWVVATFAESLTSQLSDSLRSSLMTTVFESGESADPLENAPFKLDIRGTSLQFAALVGSLYAFTPDGRFPPSSDDTTQVMITTLPNDIVQNMKLFTLESIKQFKPINAPTLEDVRLVHGSNWEGYEITGSRIDMKSGQKEIVYNSVLSADNIIFLIVGLSNQDFDENLDLFKQVTRSIKID